MVETEQYRDQLDRLTVLFPGRETIGIVEACKVTGFSRTVLLGDRTFPAKRPGGRKGKIMVPIVALARWMT